MLIDVHFTWTALTQPHANVLVWDSNSQTSASLVQLKHSRCKTRAALHVRRVVHTQHAMSRHDAVVIQTLLACVSATPKQQHLLHLPRNGFGSTLLLIVLRAIFSPN